MGESKELNNQQAIFSLICVSAKLFSASFERLSSMEKSLACNDVLKLLSNLNNIDEYDLQSCEAWVALLPILEMTCYIILDRFDDALEVLKVIQL